MIVKGQVLLAAFLEERMNSLMPPREKKGGGGEGDYGRLRRQMDGFWIWLSKGMQ